MATGLLVLHVLDPGERAEELLGGIGRKLQRECVADRRGDVYIWTHDVSGDKARIDDALGDDGRAVVRPRW